MGQAKLRGTFEQRQALGIAKREARERDRELAMNEYLANMTEAERARMMAVAAARVFAQTGVMPVIPKKDVT